MNNELTVITLRDLKYSKSGITIPTGTTINIFFSEKNTRQAKFVFNGATLGLRIDNLHKTVKGTKGVKFRPAPSLKTLEKQNFDGVCTTVTGHRVEPDGFGPDGTPSWNLVLGII
jgi:hypothetical protein